MPKICYVSKNFSAARQAIIVQAQAICEEYEAQGFILTLRQLYYQFVARDLIPNTQRDYNRLGSIINDARLAGLIDWDHLTDRTRNLQRNSHWDDPEDIIDSCAQSYAIDKWEGQEHRVEVWIEKDALIGVIEGVCKRLDVPYFSCRGYTSQSEMWRAGRRLKRWVDRHYHPVIIHLGDHDPSGVDMTRDIDDRLELFSGDVTVNRLALNMDQVEEFTPPPNPAKITDPRAATYIQLYGTESWELDALEPAAMEDLIEDAVCALRDDVLWEQRVEEQEQHRSQLKAVSDHWGDVIENLPEDEPDDPDGEVPDIFEDDDK